MSSDGQLEPIITDDDLVKMSRVAIMESWGILEHAPEFLEVRFRYDNGRVYSPMIRDCFNTRVLLIRLYTEQSTQAVMRGELNMTSDKGSVDGWRQVKNAEGYMVIGCVGMLDSDLTKSLAVQIEQTFALGKKFVILDMAEVGHMSRPAVLFLKDFAEGVRLVGRIGMIRVSPTLHEEVMTLLAQFEEHVPMFRSEEEAVQTLRLSITADE